MSGPPAIRAVGSPVTRDLLEDLEVRLYHRFRDRALLTEALTHKSCINEKPTAALRDNERLEFLGDAVLNLIVTRYLLDMHPYADEGILSRGRASIVSGPVLARVASRVALGKCLSLGRGEELTEGRKKTSILADAMEAVIASIFIDAGLTTAERCVKRLFSPELSSAILTLDQLDFKTKLQECTQKAYNELPVYSVRHSSGPDHRKIFEVEVHIGNKRVGRGSGGTKKQAEQDAAHKALRALKAIDRDDP